MALNLLASGLTFYFFRVSFQEAGDQNLPNVATLSPVEIPGLSSIPFFGDVLFSQPPLTYVALLMVPVIALYLHRTRRGLEIRIVGENPWAGDMRGLHVSALRYAAVVFGGMMAGLGGAFLTLDSAGLFVPQISGGRGFIAFAELVIVGNWSAGRILLGALFFGLIDSLQLQLQATGADVPHQLLLALPYLMTIVVLVVSRARSNSPLALGRPYRRVVVTSSADGVAGGGPFDGVQVVVDRDAADADGVGHGLHGAPQQELASLVEQSHRGLLLLPVELVEGVAELAFHRQHEAAQRPLEILETETSDDLAVPVQRDVRRSHLKRLHDHRADGVGNPTDLGEEPVGFSHPGRVTRSCTAVAPASNARTSMDSTALARSTSSPVVLDENGPTSTTKPLDSSVLIACSTCGPSVPSTKGSTKNSAWTSMA